MRAIIPEVNDWLLLTTPCSAKEVVHIQGRRAIPERGHVQLRGRDPSHTPPVDTTQLRCVHFQSPVSPNSHSLTQERKDARGYVHFPNADTSSYDLSDPYTVSLNHTHSGPGYMLSAFHQLHCLVRPASPASPTSPPRPKTLNTYPKHLPPLPIQQQLTHKKTVLPRPPLPTRLRQRQQRHKDDAPNTRSRPPLSALLRLHPSSPNVRRRHNA